MTTAVAPDLPTLSTFGAPYQDADSVVDPTTDLASQAMNRLIAQVCMLSRTATKAWVRFSVVAGVVAIVDHDAVWGTGAGVAPTVVRTSQGRFSVTWASAYSDLQAVPESHNVQIRAVSRLIMDAHSTTAFDYQIQITSANALTVLVVDNAGAVQDPNELTVGFV